MAFVSKKWRRDIGDNVIDAAARIGGAGLAAYAVNKMQTIEGGTPQSNMQKTLAIMGAPGITVIGLLGDLFLENRIIRAFCQGLYTYGAARTAANTNDGLADAFGWQHSPDFASNTGTSGIGSPVIMNGTSTPAIMNGVGYTPAHKPDYAQYAAQSAPTSTAESTVAGLAEAMLINN